MNFRAASCKRNHQYVATTVTVHIASSLNNCNYNCKLLELPGTACPGGIDGV